MQRTYFIYLLLALCVACGGRGVSGGDIADEANSNSRSEGHIAFNADSAFSFVARQVAFGPRVSGSKAHKECASYLEKTLAKYAHKTVLQEFSARRWDGATVHGINIIASFNLSAAQRVLLCAHWDSRPYADNDPLTENYRTSIDGANDGASGVGVLLEIARVLSACNTQTGIDIVLFDLEDCGKPRFETANYGDEKTWCLGSQYWSENPHIQNYRASYGILLDMVGVKNPRFKQEGTSVYYAPDVLNNVWKTASALGYGSAFVYEKSTPLIDDHLFINQITGIPTIDIISLDGSSNSGFFKHWHTTEDNLSNVDKKSLKTVGDVVLKVIL
ncbi:MAG: M28 family peptidase [Bacteroidales bacterium]|jgi:Zn-dependent M28 family amino/carboxypeptidase|nr:M28 family peptidase [Bacteroidales bacterium]